LLLLECRRFKHQDLFVARTHEHCKELKENAAAAAACADFPIKHPANGLPCTLRRLATV
jgi:hypothetical protein